MIPSGTDDEAPHPLAGMRVLEFGYGVAAPVLCRNLAHFGADTIRIESARRPDSLRQVGAGWVPVEVPWEIRRDTGPLIHFTSSGKRSVGLEVDHPEGREVFERLVAVSDVLAMNLSVEAVDRLGIDADALHAINPRLVWINMPSFGAAEGPYQSFRTWGRNIAAMAGIARLTGWPDRQPVGMGNNLPDYLTALWATTAVVGALLRREMTGDGCTLDLSQYEVALACIAPAAVEAALGGDGLGTLGNRIDGCAPQGVYPCLPDARGDERWIAVSVLDDPMWSAMGQVPGLESLGRQHRFATVADRLAHQDELDDGLRSWTAARSAWEAASELQHAGVAASPVLDNWDVLLDPHLHSRGHYSVHAHPRFGGELIYGQAIQLTSTPASPTRAAPAFGQDTRDVLSELGGMDHPSIDRLVANGVAHEMPAPDLRLERPYLHWARAVLPLPWPEGAQVDPAEILFQRLSDSPPRPTGTAG